ncbi:MAG: hypothetical protein CML98_04090 [Rhodobiaceae bacterium]|nr:hypothetical protein [Rhodobiaceae bacterium]|tara:strand:- start:169 stop:591 length:423 start_codon:yes stop_codon:yes gene_type:complete
MTDEETKIFCKKCGKECFSVPPRKTPSPHYAEYRCSDLTCDDFNGFVQKPDSSKNNRKSNLKLKKQIPEHLQNNCEICLRKIELIKQLNLVMQVHHVIEVQNGGTDDSNNLRYVCYQCHQLIHRQREVVSHYNPLINYDK